MKFKKETLQELAWEGSKGYEIVQRNFSHTSRWSIHYNLVFKFEDKFYQTTYAVGATERQYEEPYEYEDDMIECTEVFPVEKTIIVYEAKK